MKKNIKKISIFILIAMLSMAFLTACGGGKDTDTGAADTPATDAPAADDGEVYELKLSTVVNPPHQWIDMGNYFAEEVEAKTDGKVKVTVYPSAQLGNDETTIDEMRNGTVDFVIGGTQNFASFVPEYQVFGLSYLFDNPEQFEEVVAEDSPVTARFQELYDEKQLGLKLLALSNGGSRNTSNNIGPIETPADIDGMKMRLPGSPMEAKLWGALGAIPTSTPWNEVYSAIQTGVVNAFESTISGYQGSKTYEVAPYHSKTGHLYMVTHFTMSDMTWNKLPEEYRDIIYEVANEASIIGSEMAMSTEDDILKDLEENFDVKINEVDKEAFAEIVRPLYDELAESVNAKDILDMIMDMR